MVDSPQFFNRLAESFIPRVDVRFVVLLWGEKSSLNSKSIKDIPLYDYREIIKLGQESRDALLQSCKEGNNPLHFMRKYAWKASLLQFLG